MNVDGVTSRYLDVGEVRLHVATAGPPTSAKTVVLLHGFPEAWWSWRHQMLALADSGFRVLAPDMRGYNLSDKPRGVAAYGTKRLVGDVLGLLRAAGVDRALLAGHDWGGEVAWRFAMAHPDRVERLAILNCPHPLALMRGLRTRSQLAKSWYFGFFQLPLVPERALSKDDFAALRNVYRQDGFSDAEIAPYVEAFARPRALTSAINYYRAAGRQLATGRSPKVTAIACPTLVVWGKDDRVLGPELATPPARFVPDARVVFVEGASHWVQRDAAARVSELLLEHFGASDALALRTDAQA